jgi:hypothetical protein
MKKLLSIISGIFLFLSFQTASAQNKSVKQKKVSPTIVSCGICNRKALLLPKPEYQKAAKFVNVSGKVNVQILIDEKGKVIEAKAISGHPLLKMTSEKAALQAKFEPFLLSGIPIKVRGLIVYDFIPDLPTQPKQVEEKSQQTEIPKGKTIVDLAGGTVVGKAIKLLKLPTPFCNCRFGKTKDITSVIVQANIDEKGNVSKATAVSGHPILKTGSELAAKNSKFAPSLVSGAPVKAKALIVYKFVIVNKWSVKFMSVAVKDIQIENQAAN